jgi:hypothetical protein
VTAHIKLLPRGYNIGVRLIEDFLARSNWGRCQDLKETADVIAKVCTTTINIHSLGCLVILKTEAFNLSMQVAFKMFLGVTANVTNYDAKKKEFSLVLEDNPLVDYVELPEEYKETLLFSNILCGVIRGALEMVHVFLFSVVGPSVRVSLVDAGLRCNAFFFLMPRD